jgi:DNA (cytosine-5)-methyltransferase 1
MTPREWARLQGFPDSFQIVVSDVQAYKQFGNSVAIPVVEAVAKEVIKTLDLSRDSQENIRVKDLQGRQLDLLSI